MGPVPEAAIIEEATTHGRWSKMCHERWMRRKKWRDERFDAEFRRLVDEERRRPERPVPVVEHQREEPSDPERVRVEAGTRA